MKKLLFLGTILLCASNTFAIELEKEKKTEKTDKIVLMCVVRNAIDQDGEVVASVSCCKAFTSAPTGVDAVNASHQLVLCAEDKLDRVLGGGL